MMRNSGSEMSILPPAVMTGDFVQPFRFTGKVRPFLLEGSSYLPVSPYLSPCVLRTFILSFFLAAPT